MRGLGLSIINVFHSSYKKQMGERGSTFVRDNVDNVIMLTDKRQGKVEHCKFSYTFNKNRGLIPLHYLKPRIMELIKDE